MHNSCSSRFLINFFQPPHPHPGGQHLVFWLLVWFIPLTFLFYSHQNIPCWICPDTDEGDEIPTLWSGSLYPQSLIFLSLGLWTWGSGCQCKGSKWALPGCRWVASFPAMLEFRLPIQSLKDHFQDMMSRHFVCLSLIKLDCIVFSFVSW